MDDERRAATIAKTVRDGGRRRVVGTGGAGKTRLLDLVAEALDGAPVVRWNPAVEPEPGSGPGVLLADDVHLAAPSSLRVLLRWDGGVVAVHRPAEQATEQVLDAFDGAPMVLEPLRADDVRTLLEQAWGTPPEPGVVDRFLAATGGSPRLATAVAGTAPVADVKGSATLDEIVRAERQRLGETERALLDAAAVLPDLDLSLIAAAADLRVDDAAIAAEHLAGAGLAVDAGARLAQIVATTVRQLVPASAIADIVERAADAAVRLNHDLVGIARHALATGVATPGTAACLLGAARQVLEDDPEQAQVWIEAAGDGGASSGDLAALRALVGFRKGDVQATATAVDDLLRTDPQWRDWPLRCDAVEAGAVMLARRGAWDRSAELASAVGAREGGAIALAAIARLAIGDAHGLRTTVSAAEAAPAPGLRAAAATTLARGLVASLAADPAPALPALLDAARLYEVSAPSVALPIAPHALAATVACHLWEFDVASQVLAEPGASPGGARSAGDRLLQAWIALRRGDWVGASATVEQLQAAGPLDTRDALMACAVTAGTARRRGDLAAMDTAWREARSLLLRQVPDLLIVQPISELLISGARLGDRGTVRTTVAGIHRLLERAGHPPLWTLPVLWDELHIAVATDDLDGARTAARTAEILAGGGGRSAVVARAGVCWIDALEGTADAQRIRNAASGLADAGLVWEASRLAGSAAIRMSDGATMRDLLQLARGLTVERTPRLSAGASDLSPRERDVATHLLAGLTYREIGGQLYIAPKTVEHHVARIRRKLGVKSRAELLVALRRHVAIA